MIMCMKVLYKRAARILSANVTCNAILTDFDEDFEKFYMYQGFDLYRNKRQLLEEPIPVRNVSDSSEIISAMKVYQFEDVLHENHPNSNFSVHSIVSIIVTFSTFIDNFKKQRRFRSTFNRIDPLNPKTWGAGTQETGELV